VAYFAMMAAVLATAQSYPPYSGYGAYGGDHGGYVGTGGGHVGNNEHKLLRQVVDYQVSLRIRLCP
jgi:hypothetical protein